ncbi:MAG: hypothetical protein COW65_14755 [Cytophagales bacterium CG18_big_fil_WC_8_21_14_2_50_42_9]|nr:MAG: hypothetical protein COW65_14755 [Cytophagales bacterium CG18_big_fil_WC_8_21_14_2_50_42_9]
MENKPTPNPIAPDRITNSDENEMLPGAQSAISELAENDEIDKTYEGSREAGNVAAADEKETDTLDGSNANNLRTK